MMIRIPLSGKRGAGKFALIDSDDLPVVGCFRWFLSPQGYAVANVRENGVLTSALMHRLIIDSPPRHDTDHANGNKLDNRRSNLRLASRTQNNANAKVHKHSQTQVKGVRWHTGNKKWQARIRVNKKEICLGYFSTVEEAAHAYDDAARTHFGEFAQPNKELK